MAAFVVGYLSDSVIQSFEIFTESFPLQDTVLRTICTGQ